MISVILQFPDGEDRNMVLPFVPRKGERLTLKRMEDDYNRYESFIVAAVNTEIDVDKTCEFHTHRIYISLAKI